MLAHIYLSGGTDIECVRLMEWEATTVGGKNVSCGRRAVARCLKTSLRLSRVQRRDPIPRGVRSNTTFLFRCCRWQCFFPLCLKSSAEVMGWSPTAGAHCVSARMFCAGSEIVWRTLEWLRGGGRRVAAIIYIYSVSPREDRIITVVVILIVCPSSRWAGYSAFFRTGGRPTICWSPQYSKSPEDFRPVSRRCNRAVVMPFD